MFGTIVVQALLALYSIVALYAPSTDPVTLPESIHAHSVVEDGPDWDCRLGGNRICGPTNGQHTPGLYWHGMLVQAWHDGMYAGGMTE